MIDIFNKPKLDLNDLTCHSGGALGSDTCWSEIGREFGVKTNAYSYKTKYHQSQDKVEISDDDYKEGISEITKANLTLGRFGINKFMNLLARNWAQVKYSKQIFAIGRIINPGESGSRGYKSNSRYQSVDGGTGYAVQMGVNNMKDVYVFDQTKDMWFRWSYISMSFISLKDTPKILVQDFAGIGTREILPNGMAAIRNVYMSTFKE